MLWDTASVFIAPTSPENLISFFHHGGKSYSYMDVSGMDMIAYEEAENQKQMPIIGILRLKITVDVIV